MHALRSLGRAGGGMLLLCLLAVLVGGCSLPFLSASNATTASSTAACPSAVPFEVASGTIQSIKGTTLVLAAPNGNTITATYTTTTRFLRQSKLTTASLKAGAAVFVAVTQNANSTYTATTISLSTGRSTGSRPGGPFGNPGQRGGTACGRRGLQQGTANGTSAGENGATRGIAGTISQFSGNTLTVLDTNQALYTVTVSSATQIIQTNQASASSLQVGMRVRLVGVRAAQGTLNARSVTILLPTMTM